LICRKTGETDAIRAVFETNSQFMQKLCAGFGLILPRLTALSGGALSGGESDLFPWESGQMLRRAARFPPDFPTMGKRTDVFSLAFHSFHLDLWKTCFVFAGKCFPQVFRQMWKLSRAFHTMRRRSGRSDKGVLYRHGFAEALIFCKNAAPSEQLPHYHPVKNKKRLDKFR
jgi:hypothetical protein